ncbi:RUS family member 1 [Trichoderma asperellum]|uniref:RUS family member 1 n=1 Tax=Trichoderma asperellum TaxID=101201 RepID=A0A6V8R7Q1_TRIAP|nr:RUS family member 1 [Trichoderma asperellum]
MLSDEDDPMEKITDLLAWGNDVEIVELDKSGHPQQQWLHAHDGHILPIQLKKKSNSLFFRSLREWRKAMLDSFLPVGFPHSVSKDYLAYQMFDSLQAFFSTISSLLANRALLQVLGVGDASSSATFALLLTIMKDAMSRIATIVFAHRFGLRIEPDAKRYRFLADVFNDSAFFLELYSPYFGSWGKVVALSTGQALRALCGVSAGASKAALSVHFAKHDNLAELNAKEASQETAVGLIGLLVGTLVVKMIEDHSSVVILMILLVMAHLVTNYLGVCSVCMATLNRQRATILFEEYLRSGTILSPEQVAKRENIIFWSPIMRNLNGKKVVHVEFAESYGHAMSCSDPHDKLIIVDGINHTRFICSRVPGRLTPIKLLLWVGAQPIDAIRAWFAAMEVAWLMGDNGAYTQKLDQMFCDAGVEGNGRKFSIAGRDRDSDFVSRFNRPDLWAKLAEQGWDFETQALETTAPVRLQIRRTRAKNA